MALPFDGRAQAHVMTSDKLVNSRAFFVHAELGETAMISENRRLREERGRLLQEAEAIRRSGFTPEKRIQFDGIMDQVDDLQLRINRLQNVPPLVWSRGRAHIQG